MKQRSRFTVLALIFMLTLAFAFAFQVIPPILTFVVSSLGLTHSQAGALMSLFALPGIFVSIPGGILAKAYGTKHVGIFSLALVFAGTILSGLADGFMLLAFGRVIAGIGAMTIAIIAPQALSSWFEGKELGMAMGVFHAALPLAVIVAHNSFGRLAESLGWRMPLFISAGYSLIALVVFSLFYPQEMDERDWTKPALAENLLAIKTLNTPMWLVALIWLFYNASAISYTTFASDYYIAEGYSVGFSGFLTSLFMLASLFVGPLIGSLIDRVGRELYFIAAGAVSMAIWIFLVPRVGWNPLILGVLIGFSSVMIPTPVFSTIPRFLSHEESGLGFGLASTLSNIGILVGPFVVGIVYDKLQQHQTGFDLMALLALVVAGLAIFLQRFTTEKTML